MKSLCVLILTSWLSLSAFGASVFPMGSLNYSGADYPEVYCQEDAEWLSAFRTRDVIISAECSRDSGMRIMYVSATVAVEKDLYRYRLGKYYYGQSRYMRQRCRRFLQSLRNLNSVSPRFEFDGKCQDGELSLSIVDEY